MKIAKMLLHAMIIVMMVSCNSAKKYLENAQFDAAVSASASKLRKDPDNDTQRDILKEAYPKANQQDKDRIAFLKQGGEAKSWGEIYELYTRLKNRQDNVKTLNSEVLSYIGFAAVDYNSDIISSKNKAAEYYYSHGVDLMARKDKYSAREAYNDFNQVKYYFNDYKDVDKRMAEAAFMGTNNVMFKMSNQTKVILPKDFEEELLKISMKELNSQWLNYDTRPTAGLTYDYVIMLNILNIMVTPEQVKEESHTEQKEVQDGFSYLYDAKGNVKKDTAGNDIKVPKMKVITCMVKETFQFKKCTITGTLDYKDLHTNQLIKTNPITAEAVFENRSAQAVGDLNALKPETRRLLDGKPMPFPPDPQMIMDAGMILKNMTKDIIWNNKGLLMN